MKLCSLELASLTDGGMKDYFGAVREREKAYARLLKDYPCLRLFLTRAKRETDPQAKEACRESMAGFSSLEEELKARMDYSRFRPEADPEKVSAMVEHTIEALTAEEPGPEAFIRELSGYLDMLERLCCK